MSRKNSFVDDCSTTILPVSRVGEPSNEGCHAGGRNGDLAKPLNWRDLIELVDAYLASHSVKR